MTTNRRQRGSMLVELLASAAIFSFIMVAALGVYLQAQNLAQRTDVEANLHGNLRLAMTMLESELRMAGFGVPPRELVGGTTLWTPVIFYAASDAIGFRADIDVTHAQVICTPSASSTDCKRNRLYLDSLAPFVRINCKNPANTTQDLPLVIKLNDGSWIPNTCTGIDTTDGYITLHANLPSDLVEGGTSGVFTVEQVYYRFGAFPAPRHGVLARDVRYALGPDTGFPRSGASFTPVAENIESLSLTYFDASGTQLTGSPLPSASLPQVARIVIEMVGRQGVGAGQADRTVTLRSEVAVRNR